MKALLGGEGCRPRGNDQSEDLRPSGIHHHDRRLPRIFQRPKTVPGRHVGSDPERAEAGGAVDEGGARGSSKPVVGVRAVRGARVHAWDDGYGAEPRLELGDRQGVWPTKTNNARFAMDSYRRFITMFGAVVMDVPREKFDEVLESKKKEVGARDRYRPLRGSSRRVGRHVSTRRQAGNWPGVSRGSGRAAQHGGPGGLCVLVR